MPLRFVGGLQHHCVILWAVPTFLKKVFIAASGHGVVLGFIQHRRVVIDPRVSLCRLTSLAEIFCFMCCAFRTLLPFTCSDDFSLRLSCTRASPLILNAASSSSCEVSPKYLHFCSCLSFDLASCLVVGGHASTQTCVCTDQLVTTSGGATLLSFVPPHLAPFHRLPLTTLSRDSCLCTWRLTRLWTDVRIVLHLCILGTCRWDSIKDLSTWLALPLQHDWNVRTGCELPRVSVPSGSLALVFALHDPRHSNHLVDELNLQEFNRLLHLLNHGNLCLRHKLTPRGSRHCAVPVRDTGLCLFTENVVNCVDGLHLMHLRCSR